MTAPASRRSFLRSTVVALCGIAAASFQECRGPSRRELTHRAAAAGPPVRPASGPRPVPAGRGGRPRKVRETDRRS